MKIVGKTTEALIEGDRIICGVTHQVKIGREDSWIKYEINTQVREGEDTETAFKRSTEHVNEKALEVVRETVNRVREIGA